MTDNEKYQEKDHHTHILDLPDTYVGSSIEEEKELRIFENGKFVKKQIKWVPGLFKIFDEIIVNAIDNDTRTRRLKENNSRKPTNEVMSKLEVFINKDTGFISVKNNGEGIEVNKINTEKSKNIYPVELIFGKLLTSENFKDNKEKKVTGGKNGYGAKLTNIFSEEFSVETVDKKRQKLYKQTWKNNMFKKEKPEIIDFNGDPFTCITFKPDYKRFKLEGLTDDFYNLLIKRVYDTVFWFSGNMKIEMKTELKKTKNHTQVYLNGDEISCNLEKYISYFTDQEIVSSEVILESFNRWEVGVILSPNYKFMQNSLVNGVSTIRGGKHINYILEQITKKVLEHNKIKKDTKPNYIKDNLWLFVKCIIEEPTFDGQTKELMTTNMSSFGSKCEINQKMIDKLIKGGLIERINSMIDLDANKLSKKTDGKKSGSIRGIKKLDDANLAGTNKSHLCTLILTEGDSAKAMAIAGLSEIGRDKYGVFPLKGKVLNVRDVTEDRAANNEEISNLKKIIGLESGKEYDDVKNLRYGSVMFLTDQDTDGYHIKGLLMNLFHCKWKSLFTNPNFIKSMATPIVKVSKGSNVIEFCNLSDYENWKKENDTKGWNIKYYKGLGTSNRVEAKEYFKNMKQISYIVDENSDKSMIKAFDKKFADARKEWLKPYDPNNVLNIQSGDNQITHSEFVDKELIHFSNYDNIRSIPHLVDGLKPSQRKVLYASFLKNLKKDVKVSQFTGYISEKTSYHHGEMSLQGTIISMAQDFVGSNNLELLVPSGQFGTRLNGGKDHASPRYIFTRLSNLTDKIFIKSDESILKYLDDDGTSIEPEKYVPILPMILINGAIGIGSGWSTNIPQYNPKDIIKQIYRLFDGKEIEEIHPWYRNFRGYYKKNSRGYMTRGSYNIVDKTTIQITELPIGMWTDDFKEILDKLVVEEKIDNFENYSSDTQINFAVLFKWGEITKLLNEEPDEDNVDAIEKLLKLSKQINNTNMVLYNNNLELTKYNNVNDIISEFYKVRLHHYTLRKQYLLDKYNKDKIKIENRIRFINEFINETLIIIKRKIDELDQELEDKQYAKFPFDNNSSPDYRYLRKMTIDTLTQEKLDKLQDELDQILQIINVLESKTNIDLYKEDLIEFDKSYSNDEIVEETSSKISKTLKQKANSKSSTIVKKTNKARGRGKGSSSAKGRGRGKA